MLLIFTTTAMFALMHIVHGSATMKLKLITFKNPKGYDYQGHRCDSQRKCDHKLTLCLDKTNRSSSMMYCKYLWKCSRTYYNKNTINFNSYAYQIHFFKWPGSVDLKVNVKHVDRFNYKTIGYLNGTLHPTLGALNKKEKITGRQRNTTNTLTLTFQYRVYCDRHYYGPSCTKYCCPRNSDYSGHYTCADDGSKVCLAGWTGRSCTRKRNHCCTNTCKNGGTCTDEPMSFTCSCTKGYTGTTCENHIDICKNHLCMNGATCHESIDTFYCQCPRGFFGIFCENDIDYCNNVTCQNDGKCLDMDHCFKCICVKGFDGKYCENNIDECSSIPCLHGGSCTNLIGRFECACPSGFTGPQCEINADPCLNHTCLNGARCKEDEVDYTCECTRWWDGTRCGDPRPETNEGRSTIVLRGKLKKKDLNLVKRCLIDVIATLTSLEATTLEIEYTSRLFRDDKRNLVTEITYGVWQYETQISSDLVQHTIRELTDQEITDRLRHQTYHGVLYPWTTINSSGQQTNHTEMWISTNWYVLLIVQVVLAAIVIAAVVFFRKRSNHTQNTSQQANVLQEKCVSFVNEIYKGKE